MGIRETINGSNKVGFTVAGVLLVFTAGMFAYHLRPDKRPNPTGAFYTDDDGQTYFSDSIFKFAPFPHDGKTAVMAFVFTNGSQKFVGFMARYTPATQKQLQDTYDKVQSGQEPQLTLSRLVGSRETAIAGMEVKLPGEDHWTPRSKMPYPPIKGPGGDYTLVPP